MKHLLPIGLAGTLFATACVTSTPKTMKTMKTTNAPAYPLLDGRCDEYPRLAQEHQQIAPDIELFLFQDQDYVWLCYTIPAGKLGTMDLVLAAPGLSEPMDLHASAQLGEWPAAHPELTPSEPTSARWWNQHGWSGLTVPFNGTRPDGTVNWRPTPGRELQLGKARFGRGEWRLRLQLYALGENGGTLHFPAAGDYPLAVW